jgi:hypothetical protein
MKPDYIQLLTILIVWNMEAVHIGRGAQTSMKYPEELAKVRGTPATAHHMA